MKQKHYVIIITVLLITIFVLWRGQAEISEEYGNQKATYLLANIENFMIHLRSSATTLTQYDNNFTKKEEALFIDSVYKDLLGISITRNWFRRLENADNKSEAVYNSLDLIEETVFKIHKGEINDEAIIHEFGNVLNQLAEEIRNLYLTILRTETPIYSTLTEKIELTNESIKQLGIVSSSEKEESEK